MWSQRFSWNPSGLQHLFGRSHGFQFWRFVIYASCRWKPAAFDRGRGAQTCRPFLKTSLTQTHMKPAENLFSTLSFQTACQCVQWQGVMTGPKPRMGSCSKAQSGHGFYCESVGEPKGPMIRTAFFDMQGDFNFQTWASRCYRDNGKEHGNYCGILGLCRDNVLGK